MLPGLGSKQAVLRIQREDRATQCLMKMKMEKTESREPSIGGLARGQRAVIERSCRIHGDFELSKNPVNMNISETLLAHKMMVMRSGKRRTIC